MVERTFDVGGTDTVNRMGFGAMRLCGPDVLGEPEGVSNARRVPERAVELGVDFIDTADAYGPGTSERLIGETLDATREQVALSWLLHRSPVVLPIPGTADLDHLAANVAAADVALADDEVARLT